MDLTVNNVKLDDISIRCYDGINELAIHLKMINKEKKLIGSYSINSQKHYSEIQYLISPDMRKRIDALVEEIRSDIMSNYITYDNSNR